MKEYWPHVERERWLKRKKCVVKRTVEQRRRIEDVKRKRMREKEKHVKGDRKMKERCERKRESGRKNEQKLDT